MGRKRSRGLRYLPTIWSRRGCSTGRFTGRRLPHADILSINIDRALKVPGVRAVVTGEDVSDGLRGRGLLDTPILAHGKVRYVGEPIAAVAAESLEAAEEAVDLIEVE